MPPPKPITIKLAGITRKLAWNKTAEYNLGTLPRPPAMHDMLDDRKAASAFIGILWAAIQNGDDLPNPQAVAEALPDDSEALAEIKRQFWKMFPKGDDPKKADGSTPAPSPASSSDTPMESSGAPPTSSSPPTSAPGSAGNTGATG